MAAESLSDVSISCDSGNYAVLVLVDPIAPFDMVDCDVLIAWLEHCAAIKGSALSLFKSSFTNRSFSVNIGERFSRDVFFFFNHVGFLRDPFWLPFFFPYTCSHLILSSGNTGCHSTVMLLTPKSSWP